MSPAEALQASEREPAPQTGERTGKAHPSDTETTLGEEQGADDGSDSEAVDHFSFLPAELISVVANQLRLPDKLKLRTVLSKKHQSFVDDILKDDLKRVYVSATTRSLRSFSMICNNAYFQRFIQEVTFVAAAYGDPDRPVDLDAVKRGCEALRQDDELIDEALKSVEAHRGRIEPHILRTMQELRPQVYIGGALDLQWVSAERHQEVVEQLARGMSRLPRLRTVTMRLKISGPGLNDCIIWHTPEWARLSAGRWPGWHWTMEQILYDCVVSKFCVATIEGTSAFLEAVASLDKKPLSLGIGTPDDDDALPFFLHYKLEAPVEALGAIGPSLARLDLHVMTDTIDEDDGTGLHIWQTQAEADQVFLVSESAKNLEVLRISEISWELGQSYAHQSGDMCKRAVDVILESGNFLKLRELTLVGCKGRQPSFIDADKLLPFLRRHQSTLKSVSLENLCLLARSKLRQVALVMQSALRTIREEMGGQLEKFQLNVISRTHDGKDGCQGPNGEDGARKCQLSCQEYDFECFWVDRAVFEALAAQLGVSLAVPVSGDEFWAFGDLFLLF
ncbi:hypothetical protein CERZMDRAFT_86821 [Cercospora zeae-maydis SCOH1-5]|uniref:Uncharacterized protein n=1 Tax=Cercospora zeae-maydis SCOH1-5 TaxID=717836 RepID=A0A6A6F8I5_9PEZI|nr:hypothetical protein CERZMDRAFT_86821 [Cercospora zeae-maydis SCOH1-5]